LGDPRQTDGRRAPHFNQHSQGEFAHAFHEYNDTIESRPLHPVRHRITSRQPDNAYRRTQADSVAQAGDDSFSARETENNYQELAQLIEVARDGPPAISNPANLT
jgi:hypothetical protein